MKFFLDHRDPHAASVLFEGCDMPANWCLCMRRIIIGQYLTADFCFSEVVQREIILTERCMNSKLNLFERLSSVLVGWLD